VVTKALSLFKSRGLDFALSWFLASPAAEQNRENVMLYSPYILSFKNPMLDTVNPFIPFSLFMKKRDGVVDVFFSTPF